MPNLQADFGPRKIPRQERSRALVEAIVEAGTRIIRRQGREAVTTNSVAAIAGVSVGSLYQYFPNREAIIGAVARRHAQQIYDRIAAVDVAAAPTLEAAIGAIIGALFDAHFLDPALHIALTYDLEPKFSGSSGFSAPEGAKLAVVAQLKRLPKHFNGCTMISDLPGAALVVAEITHALAHAAINPRQQILASDSLRDEAVNVSLVYLRSERNKASENSYLMA